MKKQNSEKEPDMKTANDAETANETTSKMEGGDNMTEGGETSTANMSVEPICQ